MNKKIKKTLKNDQRGIVSVVVAVILMLMMSLIVLAMSQNTRREQRQTLDRQLSDQAFYNAESGINDVMAFLYKTPDANLEKKDCDPLRNISNEIDADDSGINKYSCVQYNKAPETLYFDNLSTSTPKVIPVKVVTQNDVPVTIENLTVSWDDSGNRNADISGQCDFTNGSPALPPSCDHGGLRFELVSSVNLFDNVNDREELRTNSLVSYFLPNSNNAGSVLNVSDYEYPESQGIIKASNCSNTTDTSKRRCSSTITNISRSDFYIVIRSIYNPINITISGTSGGNPVRFKNSQIMVDSTGKANDVLRRLQVRIPSTSHFDYPGFSLQTADSICKLFEVRKSDSGNNTATQTNGDADCKLN